MKIDIIYLLFTIIIVANASEYNNSSLLMGKLFGGEPVESRCKKCVGSLVHKGNHFCTAFLIADKHVLTAAQCLKEFLIHREIPNFWEYAVLFGDLNKPVRQRHFFEQLDVHNNYDPYNPKSSQDLGVLMMFVSVMALEPVTSIPLSGNHPDYSLPTEIAGWELRTDIDHSKVIFRLKEIKLALHTKLNECGRKSTNPLFCTFLTNAYDNIGLEDLGAPLIQNDHVIGILSDVPQAPGSPAIFTDIVTFRPIILHLLEPRNIWNTPTLPRKRCRYDWRPESLDDNDPNQHSVRFHG